MESEEVKKITREDEATADAPEAQEVLEEIEIEDLSVDGICGVY